MKLKEYSYEFEIDSDLQLASVDGVKVATDDKYNALENKISQLEEQVNDLTMMVSLLQTNFNHKTKLIRRKNGISDVTVESGGKWIVLEKVSLAGNGSGNVIISYTSCSNEQTDAFAIYMVASNCGEIGSDNDNDINMPSALRVSTSASIVYDEQTEITFYACSRSATITPYYTYSILLIPNE